MAAVVVMIIMQEVVAEVWEVMVVLEAKELQLYFLVREQVLVRVVFYPIIPIVKTEYFLVVVVAPEQ